MKNPISLTFTILLLAVSSLPAATRYVSMLSADPTPPYTNWVTAATGIQQALGAAAAGDMVVVTNGVYAGGVVVTNALALLSLNGPQFTIINGRGTNRCVDLTDGASLTGFTLTNGHVSVADGGGVRCATVNAFLTNCVMAGNWAWDGGGASGGTLYNCTLSGNSTDTNMNYLDGAGGGAAGSTLYSCTLSGNLAKSGGGAAGCTLYSCTLSGNSSLLGGGGAGSCTLFNCTLTDNSDGADSCTLYNCTLTHNTWGGVGGSTLYNCIVDFNTASGRPNYEASTLNYCCTTPLPSSGVGNIALDPQMASASHLSADSPCRGAGSAAYATGNDIDGEAWGDPPSIGCDEYHAGAVTGPLAVSLLATYTNAAVGYAVAFTALIEGRTTCSVWDFRDGVVVSNRPYASHAWAVPGDYTVELRAYNESLPREVSTALMVHVVQEIHYVAAISANSRQPYTSWSTAAHSIQDAMDVAAAPGALLLVSNGVYAGGLVLDKPLTLRSVNGPQFTVINGGGMNRCVSLPDGASLFGFTLMNGWANWSCGGVWCTSSMAFLTNCVITGNTYGGTAYGTLYNCTVSGNSGSGAYNSVLYNCMLSHNAAGDSSGGGARYCALYNSTLTGNSAIYGGGAESCTLYNCTLTGNSAHAYQIDNGSQGGGAEACTLYNCTLTGNAAKFGGGAADCTLYNCTLTGNSASGGYGGGADASTLNNCIVYSNTASGGGANYDPYGYSTLNYCCTTPRPTNGVGNITSAPLFVDYANGNLRLLSNSPCINAGNDSSLTNYALNVRDGTPVWFTNLFDLDGRPRLVGGTVDMGAYEFQPGVSGAFIGWLQGYGLPTDGSADYADSDHDGLNNWQEWVCGTCPTNALSVLRLLSTRPTGTNTTVTWQSVAGVDYFLQRSGNLASPFTFVATNIVGQAGTTSYADTIATGTGPVFYRVGVPSW